MTGNSSIQLLVYLGLFAATVVLARDRIDEAAEGFEALMVNRLYQQMSASGRLLQPGDDNPFAPSSAEMIYRGMYEEEILKGLASHGALGVKDLVARQLRGQSGIGVRPVERLPVDRVQSKE